MAPSTPATPTLLSDSTHTYWTPPTREQRSWGPVVRLLVPAGALVLFVVTAAVAVALISGGDEISVEPLAASPGTSPTTSAATTSTAASSTEPDPTPSSRISDDPRSPEVEPVAPALPTASTTAATSPPPPPPTSAPSAAESTAAPSSEATTTTTTATTTVATEPPTTPPPTEPTTVTTPAPAPVCDPNYSGCVPIASDVDCAGGSGDGPEYVAGPVQVIGSDVYGLDHDNDGVGCENS